MGGTYRYNAPVCKTTGCQRKPYARDMCQRCYKRWWKWKRKTESNDSMRLGDNSKLNPGRDQVS